MHRDLDHARRWRGPSGPRAGPPAAGHRRPDRRRAPRRRRRGPEGLLPAGRRGAGAQFRHLLTAGPGTRRPGPPTCLGPVTRGYGVPTQRPYMGARVTRVTVRAAGQNALPFRSMKTYIVAGPHRGSGPPPRHCCWSRAGGSRSTARPTTPGSTSRSTSAPPRTGGGRRRRARALTDVVHGLVRRPGSRGGPGRRRPAGVGQLLRRRRGPAVCRTSWPGPAGRGVVLLALNSITGMPGWNARSPRPACATTSRSRARRRRRSTRSWSTPRARRRWRGGRGARA